MKVSFRYFVFLLFLVSIGFFAKANEIDSLLHVLDSKIKKRDYYLNQKIDFIDSVKNQILRSKSNIDVFHLQKDLINIYLPFNCDSSLYYINKNLKIAKEYSNVEWLLESKIQLSLVLSISGLFSQAKDVFDDINFESLPSNLKVLYCWAYIRFNENLMRYSDNKELDNQYYEEIIKLRKFLLNVLNPKSDMYLKEKSFLLQMTKDLKQSVEIKQELFLREIIGTHNYGMAAMGLSSIFKDLGDQHSFQKYLILSAITDVELAIKDNESLLTLAIVLHEQGDVNRAFNYIQAALDDANYYNSRFRNSIIARIHPIIESTYLAKIKEQSANLRLYLIFISGIALVLIITLYFLYKQKRQVSKARQILDSTNKELRKVNFKLDEANLIRERYIGYYINQCAIYLDKLEDFRKQVLRKLKSGQSQELQKLISNSNSLDQNVQDLYVEFDRTFLEICPTFVDELNALLRVDERYSLVRGQLNTELRIFALIRLGISDVNQIAMFLRYSIQTVYNYKSKVKGKTIDDSSNFEDRVKKIGILSP